MKFDLIDQVLDISKDRIVAMKNVTTAEEYLADHFPGFAVLPGVMMLETLAQAGRKLLAHAGKTDGPWIIHEVRNLRYGNMVRPGQALEVEVTCKGEKDGGYAMQGVGKVGENVAVQGKFRLSPVPKRLRTTNQG